MSVTGSSLCRFARTWLDFNSLWQQLGCLVSASWSHSWSQVTAGSPCGCNGRTKNEEDKERSWVKDARGEGGPSIKREIVIVGRRAAGWWVEIKGAGLQQGKPLEEGTTASVCCNVHPYSSLWLCCHPLSCSLSLFTCVGRVSDMMEEVRFDVCSYLLEWA